MEDQRGGNIPSVNEKITLATGTEAL